MLESLKKANEVFKPMKILNYGIQGIGKTTFAATFPSPVLIPIEDGAGAIDVMAFPQCQTYDDVINAIGELYQGEHSFKTLILDSLDWLEPLVWAKTCAEHGVDSIEQVLKGYGKGYIEADKHWRFIMQGLDALRADRGMNIVLLAHSEIKRHEPPETEAYDIYQMKLNKRSFALWQEWADMVLFLKYRVMVKHEKGKTDGRSLATGSGERIIYTQERPAYYAKSRWPLPEEIVIGKDVTFKAFHDALTAATGGKYMREVK